MPELLTYTGFYNSPYFMRWEFWWKGKLVVWMGLEMVDQIGKREANKRFWRMVLFGDKQC